MKKEIVIYGISSYAKLVKYFFEEVAQERVSAFTVDGVYLKSDFFLGVPTIDFDSVLLQFPPEKYNMFIAIGYKNIRNRELLFDKAKKCGYELVNFVSPDAVISKDVSLGENNIIFPNVTIEPFVNIGNNNVVWSDSLISHDVVIGNHNYISAKCLIAGNSRINNLCFMGNASALIDGIEISNETQIIAGSTVFRNTAAYGQYMGNPAKLINTHKEKGITISR